MKIDLNSEEYNFEKKFLIKENILKDINEYSIFRHYVGEFHVNHIMRSPFRRDNKPSFGIFYSNKFNCLLFKDLAEGTSGDCFTLVAKLIHPTFTRAEAMAQVVIDFGLEHSYIVPRFGFIKKPARNIHKPPNYINLGIKPIGITARKYTIADYNFWGMFNISRGMLKYYNVVPISYFTYNHSVYKADKHAYAYIEKKDGIVTYKIYQPFSKDIKFFTDMDASIHAGYSNLPDKGNVLLITKSLKDVMSIKETNDISSISVLSETILIKPSVIEEYKSRFDNVIVFFDNDKAGIKMAEEYRKTFDLDTIFVPIYFEESKDFSDVVNNQGVEKAKIMLDNLVYLSVFREKDDLPF